MRTPLTLPEWAEREHERSLARRGLRSVRPLVHRLVIEDTANIGLAAEIARIGEDRAVVLPRYRTAAQERALLADVLTALRPHVGKTPRERVALRAFLDLLDEWLEPVN
jgi:hypothetical protein